MRRHMAAALLVIGLTAARARSQTDMLAPAQAADVLSNLITVTSKKADARVEALHQYLVEIGKSDAFHEAPPPPEEKAIFFNQLFKGAIQFIKNGGAQYADPALSQMTGPQLMNELSELQVYNTQQFLHLVKQKRAVDAMEAFLKSSGDLDGYHKWAKEHGVAPKQEEPKTPAEVAARMDEMIASAKATAWAKAESRGVSREDFEKEWKQRVEKHREGVASQVDGCKKLARSLSAPPPVAAAPASRVLTAEPLYPNTPRAAAPGAPGATGPQSQPPKSQITNEMFQQRNKELWDRFDY